MSRRKATRYLDFTDAAQYNSHENGNGVINGDEDEDAYLVIGGSDRLKFKSRNRVPHSDSDDQQEQEQQPYIDEEYDDEHDDDDDDDRQQQYDYRECDDFDEDAADADSSLGYYDMDVAHVAQELSKLAKFYKSDAKRKEKEIIQLEATVQRLSQSSEMGVRVGEDLKRLVVQKESSLTTLRCELETIQKEHIQCQKEKRRLAIALEASKQECYGLKVRVGTLQDSLSELKSAANATLMKNENLTTELEEKRTLLEVLRTQSTQSIAALQREREDLLNLMKKDVEKNSVEHRMVEETKIRPLAQNNSKLEVMLREAQLEIEHLNELHQAKIERIESDEVRPLTERCGRLEAELSMVKKERAAEKLVLDEEMSELKLSLEKTLSAAEDMRHEKESLLFKMEGMVDELNEKDRETEKLKQSLEEKREVMGMYAQHLKELIFEVREWISSASSAAANATNSTTANKTNARLMSLQELLSGYEVEEEEEEDDSSNNKEDRHRHRVAAIDANNHRNARVIRESQEMLQQAQQYQKQQQQQYQKQVDQLKKELLATQEALAQTEHLLSITKDDLLSAKLELDKKQRRFVQSERELEEALAAERKKVADIHMELDSLKISHIDTSSDSTVIDQRSSVLRDEISELLEARAKANTEISKLKESSSQCEKSLSFYKEQLEQAQRHIQTLNGDILKTAGEHNHTKKQLLEAAEHSNKLQTELEELKKKNNECEAQVATLGKLQMELTEKNKELEMQVVSLKETLRLTQEEAGELRKTEYLSIQAVTQLQNQLDTRMNEEEEKEEEVAVLKEKVMELAQQLERVRQDREHAIDTLDKLGHLFSPNHHKVLTSEEQIEYDWLVQRAAITTETLKQQQQHTADPVQETKNDIMLRQLKIELGKKDKEVRKLREQLENK